MTSVIDMIAVISVAVIIYCLGYIKGKQDSNIKSLKREIRYTREIRSRYELMINGNRNYRNNLFNNH